MKQSKLTFNLDGLNLLKKQATNYRARVGIIGNAAAQDHALEQNGHKGVTRSVGPISNAEIAVIQIYGSFEHNIPPRDFLLMPIEYNQKQIVKQMQTSSVKEAISRGDFKLVFKLLGAIAEGFVQQAFETGGFGQWAPNSDATVARKGSDAPLIDTGQLRRAVASEVIKAGQS